MASYAPEADDPQLLQAVAFLLSARVASTPVPERVDFLRGKGLREEQIALALAKAGLAGTDTAPGSGSGSGWLRRIVGLGIAAASAAAVTSFVRTPAPEPERAPEALLTPAKSDPAVTELASLSANVLSRHEERLAALEDLQTNFAESLSALRDDLTSVINDVIGNAFASRESVTPVRLLGHGALASPTAADGSAQAGPAASTAEDALGAEVPPAPPEFETSEVGTPGDVSVANGRKWSGRGDLRGLAKATPPTPASTGATPASTPSATPVAPSPPFDTPTPYTTCQPPTPDSTRGSVAYGSPSYGSPPGPSNGASSASGPSQPMPTGRDGAAASGSGGGEGPAAEASTLTAAEAAQSVSEQVAAAAVGSAVAAAAASASAFAGLSAAESSPGETSRAATALSPEAVMRALREGRESSLPHTSRIDDMPIGFSPAGASTPPPPTDSPPPPHASTPLPASPSTSESPPPPPSGTPPPSASPSPAVPVSPLPKPWERASLAAPIASSLGVVSVDGVGTAAAAPHAPGTELGDERLTIPSTLDTYPPRDERRGFGHPEPAQAPAGSSDLAQKPNLEADIPEPDAQSATPNPDAHSGHPLRTPTSPDPQPGPPPPPPMPKLDALAEAAATATAPLRCSEPSTAPPLASESSTEVAAESAETESGSSAETSFAAGGDSADVGPSAGESSAAALNATARSVGAVTAPSNAKAGGGNSRRKNGKGKRP